MNSVEPHRLLDKPWDRSPTLEEFQPESSEFLLNASIDDSPASERPDDGGFSPPPRSLTYLNSLALVVGLQIGSGIFSAPAVVLSHVSSLVVAVLAWLLAGLLVWTGASSFIELGTRVPQNGGIQEYLRHCYGDIYGFLFAWTWLLVSRPCAMAMVSLVFSEYLFEAIWPDQDVSVWVLKIVAFVAIISVTYLNCMGTHVGTGAANFFLVLKIFGLGSIATIGLVHAFISFKHGEGIPRPNVTEYGSATVSLPVGAIARTSSLWTGLGNFMDAVLAALFAYGGWEAISFVIGEMKEPHYTLPRVLSSSTAIVIALFVLSNAAIYQTLSLDILEKTNAVAIAFGMKVFGRFGALLYAWIVCLSCLGALNAIVFSAGRLTQAAGARKYLPSFLNHIATDGTGHNRRVRVLCSAFWRICPLSNGAKDQNVPINAMILNAVVATIYVLVGSFRGLLSFKGMIEYVVYLATVSGLLFLRFWSRPADKDPLARIYLTSISNPVVFCCVATLMVVRSAIAHVIQTLVIFLVLGTGTLAYQSRWWRQ